MQATPRSHRMNDIERRDYAERGYLLRRAVFSDEELARLRDAVDAIEARVAEHARREGGGPEITLPDGHRLQFTSGTVLQWEWREGSRAIRLIEPCDHLDPTIANVVADARFAQPMRDAVDAEDVTLFTTKLNFKRPREGSEFPWHQDYPYWFVRIEDQARDIATAILFLDDADEANGALRVLPGSHHAGPAPRDPSDPTRSLADPARIDAHSEVLVEARAGDVLFFGSLLLHRSAPNTSDRQRRVLLPSYQPAARPRSEHTPYHPEWVDRLP